MKASKTCILTALKKKKKKVSFFFLKKIKNKINNTTSWSRLFISKYESALAHGGCWAGAEGL